MAEHEEITVDSLELEAGERIPNHPEWPALCYRAAFDFDGAEEETTARERLKDSGWRPEWTGSVYPEHHYHSTAHECLVVLDGNALLQLGGPRGPEVRLARGDAVALPAGTGHRLVRASDDFQVLGAYPEGQRWDLITEDEPLDDELVARIENVPHPERDPLFGEDGPVIEIWG